MRASIGPLWNGSPLRRSIQAGPDKKQGMLNAYGKSKRVFLSMNKYFLVLYEKVYTCILENTYQIWFQKLKIKILKYT